MERRKESIDTYMGDTEECKEEPVSYELPKQDLEAQIGVGVGFEGLRGNANERGADRQQKESFKDLKHMGGVGW